MTCSGRVWFRLSFDEKKAIYLTSSIMVDGVLICVDQVLQIDAMELLLLSIKLAMYNTGRRLSLQLQDLKTKKLVVVNGCAWLCRCKTRAATGAELLQATTVLKEHTEFHTLTLPTIPNTHTLRPPHPVENTAPETTGEHKPRTKKRKEPSDDENPPPVHVTRRNKKQTTKCTQKKDPAEAKDYIPQALQNAIDVAVERAVTAVVAHLPGGFPHGAAQLPQANDTHRSPHDHSGEFNFNFYNIHKI